MINFIFHKCTLLFFFFLHEPGLIRIMQVWQIVIAIWFESISINPNNRTAVGHIILNIEYTKNNYRISAYHIIFNISV